MSTVSGRIMSGLGWTSLSTIFNGLSQILKLSILTRFLEKEDFGIVAILTFILGFTQIFSDLGFSAVVMSEKNLSRDNFLNLYWIQFLVFNIFVLVVSCISPIIANYYNQSALLVLIPLMLSELFFVSIGKLYDTILQKTMKFKIIAIRNIVASILSLVVAVVLAVLDYGVYSLVISTIFHAALVNFWNLIAGQTDYKIIFSKIKPKEVSPLLKIGLFQMGTQILDYFSSKLDILIISSFLGLEALGIYNLAKELVLKFVTILNSIVSKVMLPVLSNIQDDSQKLKSTFLKFVRHLSTFNAPIVGFLFLFTPLVVHIFYGNGYEETIPIVRIMSIWCFFVILNGPNGMIAIVTKRTDISFYYTISRLIIMFVALFLFARYSLLSAAFTMLFIYVIMFFINYIILLRKTLNVRFSEYLKTFLLPSMIISIIVVILSFFLGSMENMITYNLLMFILGYMFLVIMYLLYVERELMISFYKTHKNK